MNTNWQDWSAQKGRKQRLNHTLSIFYNKDDCMVIQTVIGNDPSNDCLEKLYFHTVSTGGFHTWNSLNKHRTDLLKTLIWNS